MFTSMIHSLWDNLPSLCHKQTVIPINPLFGQIKGTFVEEKKVCAEPKKVPVLVTETLIILQVIW